MIYNICELPRWCNGKESTSRCRRCKRQGFDPWVGKTPSSRKRKPLQYSCLEDPMDRGAQWATVQGLGKSDTSNHTHTVLSQVCLGFSGCSAVKSLPARAGDAGFIPGLGRSPGGGNVNLLHYSCLGNPVDRGAWQTAVHGFSKSQARLSK